MLLSLETTSASALGGKLSTLGAPHTLTVPVPPHVCGSVQVPHEVTWRMSAQLSKALRLPQFLPRRMQNAASLSGVQPQVSGVLPPPQVCGSMQVPHVATCLGAAQLSVPLALPQ